MVAASGIVAGVALADLAGAADANAVAAAAAAARASAGFGGVVAAAATEGGTAGETVGAVGAAGVVGAAALLGNTVSAESAEPVAVGAFAAVDTALDATCAGAGELLDEPPRNIHAAAATNASAAMAKAISIGIRDGEALAVAFALAVERSCMGLKVSTSPDCANPSLEKRSSATCTSSIGSAMLLASCDTDIGCDSSVRSFLWRTESPAAPILFGSVASDVALHKAAVSKAVDMNGST